MPILSANALEQAVIAAVFTSVAEGNGSRLQNEINAAIERHRATLLEALRLLEEQLPTIAQQREEALMAVINQSLPAALKQAIVDRAERLVAEYQQNEIQQRQIHAALESLTAKARSVFAVLTDPNLDPARWQDPAVLGALRRALAILVKKAVVREGRTRWAYFVELTVTTDPIAEPQNGSVVRMGNTRARGSRTHRRSSSPRPLVLKTRAATGPHPLSRGIVLSGQMPVKSRAQRSSATRSSRYPIHHARHGLRLTS